MPRASSHGWLQALPAWRSAASTVLVAVCLAASARAQTESAWTGEGSEGEGNWSDPVNWSAGVPNAADAVAIFPENLIANQPDLGAAAIALNSLSFTGSGWTLSGGSGGSLSLQGKPATISSTANGLNTFAVHHLTGRTSADVPAIHVGKESLLVIAPKTTKRTADATITGEGVVAFKSEDLSDARALGITDFIGKLYVLAPGNIHVQGKVDRVHPQGLLGGNGRVRIFQYSVFKIEGTLAPGADGTLAPRIGELTFASGTPPHRVQVVMASGSSLEIDVGSGGPGDNDRVILDVHPNDKGGLVIEPGVTLKLSGETIRDGVYTIILGTNGSGPIKGKFESVLFNGAPADERRVMVEYTDEAVTVQFQDVR